MTRSHPPAPDPPGRAPSQAHPSTPNPPAQAFSAVSTASLRSTLANPFQPIVFFFAGVTYDTITLTRIDRLLDNLILLLYLSVLGVLIILKGRADLHMVPEGEATNRWGAFRFLARAQPYYPMAIQFLLGGLFSAYAIFYSRSASFTTDAVFFGMLVALLVGNEWLRDRLSNLRLLVTLYAVVTFSFFTFFLPVLTGFMHTLMFLAGALLSLGVTLRTVELVYEGVPNRSRKGVALTGFPAFAVIGLLVGFYFLNWIPPVPLSLKFGGIYHQVSKTDGVYSLAYEEGPWYQVWKRSDDPFRGDGPIYCFTAVFAPVDLKTTIYHRWQHRSAGTGPQHGFSQTDRIAIPISGGREAGYRGYTVKQRVKAGDWRVDVETEDGRIIGRVKFQVREPVGEEPKLQTITY
ncbi:MAG: DUF2914 domain-containing protein [Nitrospiraceae bacterium]